ncbi:MAG: NAD(P)H-hydrate dehydratase [candidate division KSB1 bacterium]|nr:NAD(P)H-hydrate dehydratase [candidate division KSB1 bacterium]
MKMVVTAKEMAQLDRAAIEGMKIPGVVLMENAGAGVVRHIEQFLGGLAQRKIIIFCGKGNNGGDGFVIARHASNRGAQVAVFLAGKKEAVKGDALINLNILDNMGIPVTEIGTLEQIALPPHIDLIVDALLGTGTVGPVTGFLADLIGFINRLGAPVVAVDLPSGMETDTGAVHGACIRADLTVTMAQLKAGLLFAPAREFAGRIEVVDISIPPQVNEKWTGQRFLPEASDIRDRLPQRSRDAHKTSCGKVAVFAGSVGMTGAATLTSLATLQIGAGLTKLGIPASLNPILEQKATEVMTVPLRETAAGSIHSAASEQIKDLLQWADVLAVGPGLSTQPETVAFVKWLLSHVTSPMVLDADGLNAIAGQTEMIQNYPAEMVLTPHPGELARLIGSSISEIQRQRLTLLPELAQRWGKVIVLKGGPTLIAAPNGDLFINATGNPGMATGGSGDVLTGVIAGLLAQKLSAVDAALVGVYLHGLAGDLAAADLTEMGLIASDISRYLPAAIKQILISGVEH